MYIALSRFLKNREQTRLVFACTIQLYDCSPTQNTTPPTVKTSFSCLDRPMGFYADVEANCRVYHTCDDHGNRFTYRCPEETAFRQDALICDHAYLVSCQALAAYQPTRYSDENVDGNKAIRSPIESFDDPRPSFSRSFQVIQQPEKSSPNKPGFVFRASLFLREQDRSQNQIGQNSKWNTDSKNGPAVSTARTPIVRLFSDSRDDNKPNQSPRQSLPSSSPGTRALARDKSGAYPGRSSAPTSNSSPARTTALPDVTQRSPPAREKYNSDYHPYSETLRSIQIHAQPTDNDEPTTEIPVHALTLSLKPLVPNELEYDPYYPKQPTSTEAYYTPSSRGEVDANSHPSSSSQAPPNGRHNLPFEIPPVLPDLNALEDLIDRRKLFYIPRTSGKSI